jgi:dTDP-4-amino-4,6-dideoxygalactose transaminase
VIVPAYTFVSTAAAIALTGAKPIFVDVMPGTLNLDPDLVAEAITQRTKAVFTVHYAGIGDKVDQLAELCERNGISLVEDNAHGLGATFQGKSLGTFGSMSTLSFHETKNITCGEGGALSLNSLDFLEAAEIMREKGTNRARFLRGQVDKYTWVDIGSSWVASDILAAYLVAQLENFDSIQSHRHRIWNTYYSELTHWGKEQGVFLPQVPAEAGHSAHMFYLHMPNINVRDRFIEHMKNKGIMVVFHYQSLNTSNVGRTLGGVPGQCPVSESAAQTLVRLPLFIELNEPELDRIISAVKEFQTS